MAVLAPHGHPDKQSSPPCLFHRVVSQKGSRTAGGVAVQEAFFAVHRQGDVGECEGGD